MIEWDNCPRMNNCEIFDHYSPQQFYIFNKIIVEWTKNHYYKDSRFIFINAWNEWGEGSYLEPDDKYGYASINSLSKAIFNLSYIQKYNLNNLIQKKIIAVISNIFNEDSIVGIIDKTNNIPLNFDLFIFVNNKLNIDRINRYIQINTKATHFELEVCFNPRKDLLYLLYEFQNKFKKYKYICNINSNPYKNIKYFEDWKNYLHNNLLGDSTIISEILTDFENNDNLGLIFPERYYKSLFHFGDNISNFDLSYVNLIIRKFNMQNIIKSDFIDFPEGNMFWVKVNAIYSIFNLNSFTRKFRLIVENNLEKIWVYIVKLNGYVYKTIFKHI